MRKIESELNQAGRLESIGLLASGIAHEINTPSQFINDNLIFLQDSWSEVEPVLSAFIQQKPDEEIEYIKDEIPRALDQSIDGIKRITKIVQSMKSFAHPEVEDQILYDLHKSIEDTINITRNEWKYNSEVVTQFTTASPLVSCYPGLLNQVLLNIIVNAAHAVNEAIDTKAIEKGYITITTRRDSHYFIIEIEDNGIGISEENIDKIFDPFFTTKGVGKGTGQGLSLAYSIITEKHKGSISVKSHLGVGACFIVALPV
jgi:signal transduction histidine kinase